MPASSNVFEFTITFGFTERGSCGKTCRRACWLNLEAHPAQDESEVSLRICSRDMCSHPLSEISIFESRFSIGIIPGVHGGIENRQSKIENGMAERIGIEPTSVPGMRNRQRF